MPLCRTLKKWLLWPFAAKYVSMPGRSYSGRPPALTEQEMKVEVSLRRHIDVLANQIGERHFGCPEKLAASVSYLQSELSAFGYSVGAHEFALPEGLGTNLIVERPGRSKRLMVVGAHYDSIPGCRAANDNGTGTAAVLELARKFAQADDLELTLRFVLFGNEEHVGTPAEHMGSYHYARTCRERHEDILGMWSLETIGFFSEDPETQHYPSPFDLFYPTTGNFIGFVGSESSRAWIRNCVRAFRSGAKVPSEGVAAPEKFKDVNRSDHWGFGQFGYQSLMVTDTANFRYPHYHTAGDTADRINYTQLTRVVSGLATTIHTIAGAH